MSTFREFLELHGSSQFKIAHPKYRRWEVVIKTYRDQGLEPAVEIWRAEDALGYKPAKIYLKVMTKAGSLGYSDLDDWDPDLDQGLIDLNLKAINKQNEAQRYNLFIDLGFAKLENRYGDGFFNSVLVQYIKEVGDSPKFQAILKYSTALDPNLTSRSYAECREALEAVVANRARELHEMLKYSIDDITDILTDALVQNLDERFAVTNRRKMGLLD